MLNINFAKLYVLRGYLPQKIEGGFFMLFGRKCEKYCRLANYCFSNTVCIFDQDGCTEQDFLKSQYEFVESHMNSCEQHIKEDEDDD